MSELLRGPGELLDQVRGLPAAGPLLARLDDRPGVYLVGGAVRDLLLGGVPFDLDLVVVQDAAALAATLGGKLTVHDRFGTSTVRLEGFAYDIGRARRETYAHPGALPDVLPAPLEEDLLRRDFTLNSIAIALGGDRPGELHAAPSALEDLDARRLRVLHDRSFIDDPTRLFRMVRYAGRLGFEIEPHTRALAGEAIDGGALATVSGPRVGAELRLLARERDPVGALLGLGELRLDRAVHPGFGLADEALARRALELLPADGRADRLVLAVARGASPRRSCRGCSIRWRSRPRIATRSSPLRRAHGSSRTLWRPLRLRRRSPPPWAAGRPSWWRWRARSGRSARRGSGSTGCATSASTSTDATSSPPACPRARPSAAACARRWPRSSIGGHRGASKSWPRH